MNKRDGSFEDIEKKQGRKPDIKKCKIICGFTYKETQSYSLLLNNCANFAINNWLENTGEDLANPNTGIQEPSGLYMTIKYGPQPYNPLF